MQFYPACGFFFSMSCGKLTGQCRRIVAMAFRVAGRFPLFLTLTRSEDFFYILSD